MQFVAWHHRISLIMDRERFRVLDGWRGICALLVALFHFNAYGHFYTTAFVRNAWLFVDFFFVLSGFVITHAYADKLDDFGEIRAFIIKRFGRLWPLHFAVLFFLIAIESVKFTLLHFGVLTSDHPAFSGGNSLPMIATNIFLVQALGIHDSLSWNGPAWSVSTEFYACILFAAACWIAGKKSGLLFFAAATVLGSAAIILLFSGAEPGGDIRFGFFRCLYGFFIGYMTYRFWQSRWKLELRSRSGWPLLEAAALGLVASFVSVGEHSGFSLAAPPVFAFAIWVFAHERGTVSRIMSSGPMLKLGALSYSIYMVHAALLVAFGRVENILGKFLHLQIKETFLFPGRYPIELYFFGDRWLMDVFAIVYLMAVIALAALTYRKIELPGIRFFNALAAKTAAASMRNAAVSIS